MATAAAKTDTFLGERYRRIVKRRGKLRAMVAVAHSILVIIWHLLADPASRFHDLGPHRHPHPRSLTTRHAGEGPDLLTSQGPAPACPATSVSFRSDKSHLAGGVVPARH